jgi:hypothetical protein
MNGIGNIVAIHFVRLPDEVGDFQFTAQVEGTAATIDVQVPADAMLEYRTFQVLILRKTGAVWAHHACEGRSYDDANRVWHELVRMTLAAPAPMQLPPHGLLN